MFINPIVYLIYTFFYHLGYGQDIPVHFSAYLPRMEHEPIANRSENPAIVLTNTNTASHPGKTAVKLFLFV